MGLSARAVIDGLSPAKRRELDRFIMASMPREACGLVLIDRDGEGSVETCVNLADDYHAMDPQRFPLTGCEAYVLNPMAIVHAEKRGHRVIGIWHSHVGVGAYFSHEDAKGALLNDNPAFPGVDFVVFDAHDDGIRGFRVFRHDGDTSFIEVDN